MVTLLQNDLACSYWQLTIARTCAILCSSLLHCMFFKILLLLCTTLDHTQTHPKIKNSMLITYLPHLGLCWTICCKRNELPFHGTPQRQHSNNLCKADGWHFPMSKEQEWDKFGYVVRDSSASSLPSSEFECLHGG